MIDASKFWEQVRQAHTDMHHLNEMLSAKLRAEGYEPVAQVHDEGTYARRENTHGD